MGLDGDQRGVDFEHHLVLMRLLAVSVAKCHVSPEYRHVVSREGNVPRDYFTMFLCFMFSYSSSANGKVNTDQKSSV